MIGDRYYRSDVPLTFLCSHGEFLCTNLVDGEELRFDFLRGRLAEVGYTNNNPWGHSYNYLKFRDKACCFVLYASRTNSSFCRNVVLLHQQPDKILAGEMEVELHGDREHRRENVIALYDKNSMPLEEVWAKCGDYRLPLIKRVKGDNGKQWCDYSARLAYMDALAADINSRLSNLRAER